MLFSNYLETLLGSKARIKMLRALVRFNTKRFTSRELANYVGISHTAVLKSLKDLQGMNIIRIESHATSNLITLNSQSMLYNELAALFSFESKTLEHLKKKLKKSLPNAITIALFGSVAAKKENLNSDIDLIIIAKHAKDKNVISEQIAKIQQGLINEYGNVISVHIMTQKEFKQKKDIALVRNIMDNHIIIKGERL